MAVGPDAALLGRATFGQQTDLELPRIDGATVLRELRRDETRNIPVLIVTRHGELVAAVHDGEVRVLMKPFDTDVLVRQVHRLTRGRPAH